MKDTPPGRENTGYTKWLHNRTPSTNPLAEARPMRRPRGERRCDEWLGDALLRFYVREYLVEKHKTESIGNISGFEQFYQTNDMLTLFAKLEGIPGGANRVEELIYEKFKVSPEEARTFVRMICKLHDSGVLPRR